MDTLFIPRIEKNCELKRIVTAGNGKKTINSLIQVEDKRTANLSTSQEYIRCPHMWRSL